MESIVIKHNGINYVIDPRIELLSVVKLLCNYQKPYLTVEDFKYKTKVIEYFNKYKDHEVVKLLSELSNNGFTYHAPVEVMLYTKFDDKLTSNIPFTDEMQERGSNKINKFINLLSDFAEETKFNLFFEENRKHLETIIKTNLEGISREALGKINLTNYIEQFYKIDAPELNVIFALLHGNYGFGINLNHSEIGYMIIGVNSINKKGMPLFIDSNIHTLSFIYHETAHTVVNNIAYKFIDQILEYGYHYNQVESIMRRQAYGNWITIFIENTIRALELVFMSKYTNQDYIKQRMNKEINTGFIWVPDLYQELLEYDLNKDKYKNFEAFFPKLIEVLKKDKSLNSVR